MPRPPKPGGAVIEPRSFTQTRAKFGRTASRLQPGVITSPQHGAAELQHALANAIREHLLDSGLDLKSFSEATDLPAGLSYDRFQRINRGETMMTLTDLAFWAARIPRLRDVLDATLRSIATDTESSRNSPPTQDPTG